MIKNKNIWFFHHYATPPTMSGFSRPYSFARNLANKGYDTTVFAASYLHFSEFNLINDNTAFMVNNDTTIPFVFLKTPSSLKGNFARVKNMVAFYRQLFRVTKEFTSNQGKPDLIIASSPHPLAMVAGIKIARKIGVPCICEVRDFWPEVFFTVGIIQKESILGKLLVSGEHWIYKNADAIIFLKEGDYTYILDNKWDTEHGGDIDLRKCHYINNGVDIEAFNSQVTGNVLDDPDLIGDKFNVVYTGAIRLVNNVENILDAAVLLKEYTNIQFLIYGEGNQLEILKKRTIKEGLHNVKIKGYVDKKYIPFVLSKSGVNILNYSQSKYNWSRGNSSNKLFEYMMSGKPIISTVKMGYCLLEKYKCGFSLRIDTPEELAQAILSVYGMPKEQYNELCQNSRKGAADFDYKTLTSRLIRVIESVC